jgi:predicted ATPase
VGLNELILHRDASNIANVLSARLGDDGFQADFDHYTRLAFPDYKRIHFQPDSSGEGKIISSWHSKNLNRPLNLWELSDGMFKYLCLLAVLLRPHPGSIICLDEPEVGLHPRLIAIVADLIRSASDTAQVIATTHNPSLVSHFGPSDVIVVEASNGESQFQRLSERDLAKWLAEFTLGELMAMGELEQQP